MFQKKNGFSWRLAVFAVLWLLLGFFQTAQARAETISDFAVDLTLKKDGAVLVSETIIYDFGSEQKHGIFRDIPLTAKDGPSLSIAVRGVKDETGQPHQYVAAVNNDVLRLKIGDPNRLVSGIKTYVINYEVYNAVRMFDAHDELYWNVTGNEWPVGIQSAMAVVTLPDAGIADVKKDCFTGSVGSIEKNCLSSQDGVKVNYFATRPLPVNEGLTFVLGVPKGYIQNTAAPPSSAYSAAISSFTDSELGFLVLAVAISVLLLLARIFFRRRSKLIIPRELKGRPVVVEYNPPDNLPPLEVGTLLDRRVDSSDISSVILDLAVRGYLKIRYTVEKIRFWPDKKDYELVKVKSGADLVHPGDKIIYGLLFSGRNSVKLSALEEQKTGLRLKIKKLEKEVERYLSVEKYFDSTAKKKFQKREALLSVLMLVFLLGFFVTGRFAEGWDILFFVLFVAMMITLAATAARPPLGHLTAKGVSALAKILGFKEFLQLTEKDKLALLNAPKLQPEMFEKFLPYAMVLGVEKEWAQKFEGLYVQVPEWYEDPSSTGFSSMVLAHNLTLFNASFNQAFHIATTTSKSGFGGGGFSGGGSGGGGGGSW